MVRVTDAPLQIRVARADDAEALDRLYRELHPADPIHEIEHLHAVLLEVLASPYFEVIVAEKGGEVVSTCYLNVIPNLTYGAVPYALLENVVTLASCRRQGIGRKLVRHALERAWQRGCYKVMLLTGSQREAVHDFYRSCGFRSDEKMAFVARVPRRD